MFVRILIFTLLLLVIDWYVFQGVKVLMQPRTAQAQRLVYLAFWLITLASVSVILIGYFYEWSNWNKFFRTYAFAFIVTIYFSKLFVALFLLVDDGLRLFRWTGSVIDNAISGKENILPGNGISRYAFLSKIAFFIGAIPLSSMMYGILRGPNRFDIRKVKLGSPGLPDAFHGLKILQISDLHVGSFLSPQPLERAVDLILEQKPDVIFFTGDLVNDRYVEAVEYADLLKKITAPMGVYSILGNHDYGDYYHWSSREEKHANLEKLKKFQRDLGWRLLLNEHEYLEKDGHRVGLIGIENWSAKGNFSRYGNMKQATEGFRPESFNILLSHDPSHWSAEVTRDFTYIDLTLSGHTHGFQFGVEIPGFKWSPVQYVYKEWADLYASGKQQLYVNRGLGWIGYPGRVGILPEITVFELQKA